MTTHTITYFSEMLEILSQIDVAQVEKLADELVALRERGGRLFLAGLGGSAANCSHAANDFRKLCGIQAICLTDNVAELTARINDDGWPYCFSAMLAASYPDEKDALMILSVGGGTDQVSLPLTVAINAAHALKMNVFGIVGRDGGRTKARGDCVILIPVVEYSRVTPHTEAFQMVIIHALVSHPSLQVNRTKW